MIVTAIPEPVARTESFERIRVRRDDGVDPYHTRSEYQRIPAYEAVGSVLYRAASSVGKYHER